MCCGAMSCRAAQCRPTHNHASQRRAVPNHLVRHHDRRRHANHHDRSRPGANRDNRHPATCHVDRSCDDRPAPAPNHGSPSHPATNRDDRCPPATNRDNRHPATCHVDRSRDSRSPPATNHGSRHPPEKCRGSHRHARRRADHPATNRGDHDRHLLNSPGNPLARNRPMRPRVGYFPVAPNAYRVRFGLRHPWRAGRFWSYDPVYHLGERAYS